MKIAKMIEMPEAESCWQSDIYFSNHIPLNIYSLNMQCICYRLSLLVLECQIRLLSSSTQVMINLWYEQRIIVGKMRFV